MKFEGIKFPGIGFVIVAPDPMVNSARFLRIHNRISKNALKAVLLWHWETNTPKHFKQHARGKYDYAERSRGYKAKKRAKFGSITDLVKSGRTRDALTTQLPRVSVRGSSEKILFGRAKLARFPFPVSKDVKDPRRVTVEKMADEIVRWVDSEAEEAVNRYADIYITDLKQAIAGSKKWRKAALTKGIF